jgi:hypothetical protein
MRSRYNRVVLALAVAALALFLSSCALVTLAGKIATPQTTAPNTPPGVPTTTTTTTQPADPVDTPKPPAPLTCANMDCAPGFHCQESASGPTCVPVEPPQPAGCSIDGEPGPALPGHVSQLGERVNAAVRTVTGQDGGRIVVSGSRQAFQAAVIDEIRAHGLCAGQHEPGSDEIAVATSPTAPREGYHVYAGPDAGPGTAVLSPQADHGAYAAPVVTTEPQPASCGEPVPPALGRIKLECHAGREGVTVCDSTPLVYSEGGTFCASIGFFNPDGRTGRLFCSPRQEGDPQRLPCEQGILGAPAPVFVWSGPPDQFVIRENPFTVEFSTGKGTVKACNAGQKLCSEVKP